MASIARSLRALRPATFAKTVPVRTLARTRAFTTSPIVLEKRYTRDHEWIDINPQKMTGVIGISEYAAEALGDVVYVELPEAGDWVAAGDAIGAVESVKSASDINTPVKCKVVATNGSLEEKPSIINQVPEDDSAGGGWLAKVEVDETSIEEFNQLLTADEYIQFTKEVQEEE